ncbi:MAG: nucleotidyltransferase domain-containing protein [Actinomycetes bacterium]
MDDSNTRDAGAGDADPTASPDVASALGTYLEIVDSCAPGLVEGLYVVGSFALDDWQPGRSDNDIVAVTAEPATDEDAANLVTAHALLAEHQPRPYVDGPYVAWGDLITPPMALHRPWSLEGRLLHDGDCFELNPVTWYVLATHGVTVRGPAVDRLGVYLDVDARVRFVVDNLASYWAPLADQVREACEANPDHHFTADALEWCALGALRLHHTAFQGGVVSKTGAGEYGLRIAPSRFAPVLREAMAIRAGTSTATSASAHQMLLAAELITWCTQAAADAAAPGV